MKKIKKFSSGGFSEAQEKWLGGADRTDPHILARMRAAVPDEEEVKIPETAASAEFETEDDAKARLARTAKRTKKAKAKSKENAATRSHSNMNPMGDTYKSGGSVSASRRADGIAQRGKTRGKIC